MVPTLGGSNLSSITKTTPSSVSELLFLAFLLTMSSLSGTEEPELVVLLSDESAVLGALGTSVIGVTSSLRRKKKGHLIKSSVNFQVARTHIRTVQFSAARLNPLKNTVLVFRMLSVCNRGDTIQYHGGLRSRS